MNHEISFQADGAEHHDPRITPRSFEMDSILAQQIGAGELLERLYAVVLGASTARRALQHEPDRIPELIAFINEPAVETYKALMRAIAFS